MVADGGSLFMAWSSFFVSVPSHTPDIEAQATIFYRDPMTSPAGGLRLS